MKALSSFFKNYLSQWVPKNLPHQAKILKYTCLVVLFSSLIALLTNTYLGFPFELNLIIACFALFVTWIFIKMPLYDKYNQTALALIVSELVTLSINWFSNGGLFSSTPYFFLLLIGFAAVSLTGRYLWGTVTLCLFTFTLLVELESLFPQWVTHLDIHSLQLKSDIILSIILLGYLLAWFVSAIIQSNQKRYEEVEQASQAKSLFLSQLSHELRTPLNAIIGFSNLMLKQQNMPEAQLKYLKSINTNGFHLLALVNQVMDLSMIEAGKIELHWQAVDPIKLLQEIEDVIHIEASAKALHYITRIEVPPIEIKSDPNRLRQILINLINNALKYTDAGTVTCRLSGDEDHLYIDIEDTGSGIPEDKQSTIFEPLFRLEKHHQKDGNGMGLSISLSLCKHLGYRLNLLSSSPQGSTFRLILPRRFKS